MYSLLRYRRRPAASLHSASEMFFQWRAPVRSNSRTLLGNGSDAYATQSRDSKSVGGGDGDEGEGGDEGRDEGREEGGDEGGGLPAGRVSSAARMVSCVGVGLSGAWMAS